MGLRRVGTIKFENKVRAVKSIAAKIGKYFKRCEVIEFTRVDLYLCAAFLTLMAVYILLWSNLFVFLASQLVFVIIIIKVVVIGNILEYNVGSEDNEK